MNFKEAEGKALFKQYEIPIPIGIEITSPKQIPSALSKISSEKVIVKAQVYTGGRGKAGGVVSVCKDKLPAVEFAISTILSSTIKGFRVKSVLLEEALDIQQEWYLSITIDRSSKGFVLLYSKEGGVDIEELAKTNPEKIKKIPFFELSRLVLDKAFGKEQQKKQLTDITKKLFTAFQKNDATLIEINPLILTKKKRVIAADAKMVIDDNALFRQKFQQKDQALTPIEQKAREYGLPYVELEGNIAVIGNGAGMVMATLDMIHYYRGKPANFLDIRGGTGTEEMEHAIEVCMMKQGIKGLLINIFAGITHCDEIARGIVNYKQKKKINVPIIVRMIGTNEKEGRALLKKEGIYALDTMEEAAKKIVKVIG